MTPPSEAKVAKQADQYAQQHQVVMPPEWKREYKRLNRRLSALRALWEPFERLCPANDGGRCICRSFPEYKTIMEGKIIPTVAIINKMSFEETGLNRDVYDRYYKMLMSALRMKHLVKEQRRKQSCN